MSVNKNSLKVENIERQLTLALSSTFSVAFDEGLDV